MHTAVIDIESTKFKNTLNEIDKIFCIGVKIDDQPTKIFTNVYIKGSDGNLNQALNLINQCNYVIGHNIIKFDIPVIERLIGRVYPKRVDTLIDAKLMYSTEVLSSIDKLISNIPPNLIGSFSLKAFGYRLGLDKLEYDDFTKLCPQMLEYCKRDVDLTYKLYKRLISKEEYPLDSVRECEYHFAKCISDQQEYGFYFDYNRAMNYATSLKINKLRIEHKLKNIFKPILAPDGEVVTPSKTTKRKLYLKSKLDPFRNIRAKRLQLQINKNGKWKFPNRSMKYFDYPHRLIFQITSGAYQKLKLQTFNPGSRSQVVDRIIKDYGWVPTNYTEKGSVKLEFE